MKLSLRTRWKLKRLRKLFRAHHTAAAICAKNLNASGHQLHYQEMREIYAQMRELDPHCPSWQNTRQERRAEAKLRRKGRGKTKLTGK